jgi:hypothetical protein
VNRIVGMLAILLATGCGAENWYFDRDAGAEDAMGPVVEAGVQDDDAAANDSPEGGALREAGVVQREAGPAAEAGPSCTVDSDCPASAPECSAAGMCVRCTSSSDCQPDAGTPACNTMTGACVQCTLTADCAGNALLPYCDMSANVCVRCLSNVDCGFESICLITTHTCTKMF